MLKDILKLTLIIALGIASIALLLMFGVFVLIGFAVIAPIVYIYMRMRYPAFFASLNKAHEEARRRSHGGTGHRQDHDHGSACRGDYIEGRYERVDDDDEAKNPPH